MELLELFDKSYLPHSAASTRDPLHESPNQMHRSMERQLPAQQEISTEAGQSRPEHDQIRTAAGSTLEEEGQLK